MGKLAPPTNGVLISSRATPVYKRLVPLALLASLPVELFVFKISGAWDRNPVFLLFVLGFPLVIFLALYWLVLRVLADEVYDCVDSLVVRKDGVEERILLPEIHELSCQYWMNPARVVLRLQRETRLGSKIIFVPQGGLGRIAKAPEVESLIARVSGSRRG